MVWMDYNISQSGDNFKIEGFPYIQSDEKPTKTPSTKTIDKVADYLAKGKTVPVIVDSNLVKPNGIVGSADGKSLFVADIGDKKTYKYQISKNGILTNRTLFAEMGSDGMTLDNKSNLYLTGRGVTVFNSSGKQIAHIEIPGWTANVCFSGKKRDVLFITSNTAVYTLQMIVKGIWENLFIKKPFNKN